MKLSSVLIAAGAALFALPANAAVIGDFRLDGNLNNAAGGALSLANNGGTLGATGITFAANQGPTISGFANPVAYSIELAFSLTDVGGYRKLLDFQNRGSDTGLYALGSALNFYPVVTGAGGDFASNQMVTVILTHDANSTMGYVNGVARWSFGGGANSLANISSVLHAFRDDFATGQREASGGFVDYIRVYDTQLSAAEIGLLLPPGSGNGGIPEPAAWAMMLTGFGFAGSALRRQKKASVRFA